MPGEAAGVDFSHVVATVVIVAAGRGQERRGCTASVWAEAVQPPLVLVTLDHRSSTRAVVLESGAFSVNLLGAGQEALAWRFGTRKVTGAERFEEGEWDLSGEPPVLLEARASYSCLLRSTHPFGAHEVLVGEVTSWSAPHPEMAPLVFVHGEMLAVGPPGPG